MPAASPNLEPAPDQWGRPRPTPGNGFYHPHGPLFGRTSGLKKPRATMGTDGLRTPRGIVASKKTSGGFGTSGLKKPGGGFNGR